MRKLLYNLFINVLRGLQVSLKIYLQTYAKKEIFVGKQIIFPFFAQKLPKIKNKYQIPIYLDEIKSVIEMLKISEPWYYNIPESKNKENSFSCSYTFDG